MRLKAIFLVLGLLFAVARVVAEEIRVGDQTRTYQAIVPRQSQAVPLVLVLHGNSQQGKDMVVRTSWPKVAEREHFVVVFPDGLNRAWNDLREPEERAGLIPPEGTDDVAFLVALVELFIKQGIADRHRIYVTGLSNGGAMTLTLACKQPDLFAAAASAIMEFTATMQAACKPAVHIPILMMNGTLDPLIPYEGGQPKLRRFKAGYLSTIDTLNFWRRTNGCDLLDQSIETLADVDTTDQTTVTRINSHCSAGTDVVLYRINGGGHRLPDQLHDSKFEGLVDSLLGRQSHDINGPEIIWAFLNRYSRK